MPLFPYKCSKCDLVAEVIQKHDDDPPVCECGGPTTRLQTTAAFALRGGGWAKDGYKSTPKDSIPAKEFGEAMMERARTGGPEGVRQFQREMHEKHGGT